MGHSISAFVAKRPAIAALSKACGGAPFYKLDHAEFLIMPVSDEVFDKIAELKGISDPVADGFWGITARLADVAREHSVHGPIAYIETDYFGGQGSQGAAAWQDGEPSMPPAISPHIGPINTALGQIGLIAVAGQDAFDTLGLGQVRHTSDFDEMTAIS